MKTVSMLQYNMQLARHLPAAGIHSVQCATPLQCTTGHQLADTVNAFGMAAGMSQGITASPCKSSQHSVLAREGTIQAVHGHDSADSKEQQSSNYTGGFVISVYKTI